MYTNFVHYKDQHPAVTLLDMLQHICSVVQAKECGNEECDAIKQKLEDTAPACEWKRFRDWALVVISCQLNASKQGLEEEVWSWGWILYHLTCEAHFSGHGNPGNQRLTPSVNLFDVCELINWLDTINSFIQPSFTYREPLRTHISKETIVQATEIAHQEGICVNRLWNLTVGGREREEVDLPVLMKMLQRQSQVDPSALQISRQNSEHDDCTAEVCCFSSIDSTRVQQLHKCSDSACGEPLLFPNSGIQNECITWWVDNMDGSDEVPRLVDAEQRYLAISHVWSDGTGGGIQGEGHVNRCLFRYFRKIATRLNCNAVWWDTISIPSERIARQKAISRMHENFSQASHTIIHDESIAQSPWIDGGHSCLALLLSPWFTRAWTALELRMAQEGKISVVFRDPNDPEGFTLKNLDEKILANHPAYSSRGHWIASSLIKQLRQQQFNNVGDILKVLRIRSTSWPRDIMVVAGLLTGHSPDLIKSDFIALIVRDIVTGLVVLEESFLYHGHTTMKPKGGWSWCPFSLLDVQLQTYTDMFQRIYVDEEGAVTGYWNYRALSKQDVEKLQPHSFHISVAWQIRMALARWEYCLLLQHSRRDDSQVLLAVPLGVGVSTIEDTGYQVLECQFVGTVYQNLGWDDSYPIAVRFGKLDNEPMMKAKDIIDIYEAIKGPRFFILPQGKKLECIRKARKEAQVRTQRA